MLNWLPNSNLATKIVLNQNTFKMRSYYMIIPHNLVIAAPKVQRFEPEPRTFVSGLYGFIRFYTVLKWFVIDKFFI